MTANSFYPKLTSITFKVKNVSPQKKRLMIFNYPIEYLATRDLLTIPEISESDIRESLIKGELANKIRVGAIQIISSSIELEQFDNQQLKFITNAGSGTNGVVPSGSVTPLTSWSQTDWYVDWTHGNDANDGKTSGTAVKTVMGGVVTKWGTNSPLLSNSTTIHMLSDQPLNAEEIILQPFMNVVGQGSFNIIGTPTVLGTTTLSAVVAKNRATNTQFQAAGFGSYPVGSLVHNTTAGKNSYAIIRTNGGGTAQLSQPLAPISANTLLALPPAEFDTWANTDTVTILKPTAINLFVLNVTTGMVDSSFDGGVNLFQYLDILDPSGTPFDSVITLNNLGSAGIFDSCVVETYVVDPIAFETVFSNCYLTGGGEVTRCVYFGGIIKQGIVFNAAVTLDGDVIVDDFCSVISLCLAGYVNIGNKIQALTGGTFRLVQEYYSASIVWGVGVLDVQPGGNIWNSTGNWTTALFTTTLTLKGATTGTAYSGTSFINGITLTPTHLDGYGSIFNVNNGARYTL